MTDFSRQCEQLDKDIRSILTTSASGLTCHEIAKFYHEVNDSTIDYRSRGFASLSSFLRSLDFVGSKEALDKQGNKEVRFFLAKFDCEHTKRLHDLVKKQKEKTSRPYCNRYNYVIDRVCPKRFADNHVIPELMVKAMQSVVDKYAKKCDLTIEEFLKRYKHEYNYDIMPKMLGFKDLDCFFDAFVRSRWSRVDEDKYLTKGILVPTTTNL